MFTQIYRKLYPLMCIVVLLGTSQTKAGSVEVLEESWTDILDGEWMIEFFAPWCPACRALQPAWDEFSSWSDDLGLKGVAQVDVTKSPGLSGRFMVTALPTIFHVHQGVFRQYRGPRDKDSLISFIEEKKWKEIEPISAWKDPASLQMSMVSYFFKMSMFLRNVHSVITDDYGYPYWASYLGFALATIIIGALMGLILVCCIDCVFPPSKQPAPISQTVSQGAAEDKDGSDSDDDLPEDDQAEKGEPESESSPATVRKRRAKRVD